MISLRFAVPLTLLLFLSFFVRGSAPTPARAEATTILRVATLVPSGSPYSDLLRAWSHKLKKATDNRVQLRFYTGGSQGDERDFVRKMRVGQMDAAIVTTTGLGILVRPVLVLTLPGVIESYDQLDRAREALSSRFSDLFRKSGVELLTWADAGKARIFSAHEFAAPADIKSLRPWAWKDDPIFAHYLKVMGANPVRLGLNEVYAGLQTRMVDTVPASAVAAIALQWFTKLKYMAKQNYSIVVGAVIVEKEKFEALSQEDQRTLRSTANEMTGAFQPMARRDDGKAYESLLKRGVVEVDLGPNKAAWDDAANQTRTQLTGLVYSKSLLQEVERVVQGK